MSQFQLVKINCFIAAMIIYLFFPWTGYGQELRIDVLDIGQGDSILVTTPQKHHILIDGGPDSSVIDQIDEVLPFWQRRIDLVMPSHPQADHINGIVTVLRRMEVINVLDTPAKAEINSYKKIKKMIEQKNITETTFTRGDSVNTNDGVTIRSLWPPADSDWDSVDDLNDVAEVFVLRFGYFQALFTGDAGANVDQQLTALGDRLRVDLLKVAHHGSKTGTDTRFLQTLEPTISVISVGKDNRYGHPAQSTIQQLQSIHSDIWRTDRDGRVEIIVNQAGISVYSTK